MSLTTELPHLQTSGGQGRHQDHTADQAEEQREFRGFCVGGGVEETYGEKKGNRSLGAPLSDDNVWEEGVSQMLSL